MARGLDPEPGGNGYLDGVPVSLPALSRALKLQERAARVGFDWKETGPVIDKIANPPVAAYTDPVPQALVLTAIVIGFAMTALFLVVLLASRGFTRTDHVDGRE